MSVKSKKAIEGQLYSLFLQDLPPSRAAEIVNHSHREKVITEKTCIRFYKTFKRKGKNQQRSNSFSEDSSEDSTEDSSNKNSPGQNTVKGNENDTNLSYSVASSGESL
ncbi:UNVERIFIED_CONTAM: hypothetical protein RMT77_011954 [Armadillidium vulgare]